MLLASIAPPPAVSADLAALLDSLRSLPAIAGEAMRLETSSIGQVEHGGLSHDIPRIRLIGPPAGRDPIQLALFAGIHGDEPAGCLALAEFATALAADPARAAGYDLFFYPVVNPTGYLQRTRCNHRNKDLNREFWRQSSEVEVRVVEGELRARAFAGIITLHADDTSPGIYGYAHGRTLNEALLVPALEAARDYLPIDERAVIDGFPARAGLICDCFPGVLSAPPEQRPKPFDLIFETPGLAPIDQQVAATVAALERIIALYPGFISYGQDL